MRIVLSLSLLGALLLPSKRVLAAGEAVNGFPNWQERVMHQWSNRARSDPQAEMAKCGAACGEAACYKPTAPLPWNEKLNRAARFHSDNMRAMSFFDHPSRCTLVPNINTLYPGSCQGAASCACVGGTAACSPACTSTFQRVSLFGVNGGAEIIAGSTDPNDAFYQWLFERYPRTTCGYDQGPPTNGHRHNILVAGPAVGYGAGAGPSVGDFGGSGAQGKIASGSHYPRQSASVEAWASWYDSSGPRSALVNVDGACSPMRLARGSVTNGAYQATLTGVGSGCHRYIFLFTDAQGALITYPGTGSLGIGGSACADWDTTRPPTGAGCQCTPRCSGKTCGDDGCGGSCGACPANQTCLATGQCSGTSASDGGAIPGVDGGAVPGADGGVIPPSQGPGSAPDGTADQGCSCGSAGQPGQAHKAWLAAAGLLLALRRRRLISPRQ